MTKTQTAATVRSGSVRTVRSFSTAQAPKEDRIPLWENQNRKALVELRASCLARESLSSTMLSLPLKTMNLVDITANDHVVERTAHHIERAPADTLMFCLLTKGDAYFYSSHGTDQLTASEAILYDPDEPFIYGFHSSMRQHIFEIPRSKFKALTNRDGLPKPVLFSGADKTKLSTIRKIFATTMRSSLLRNEIPDGQVDDAFDEIFCNLLNTGTSGIANAYFTAAKDFVRSKIGQPGLSVGDIANAVGISERQLARIFSDHNIGVAEYVSEARLHLAHDMLSSARMDDLTIGQIARRVGYQHLSHFSRSFKAKYGTTAREIRKSSLSMRTRQ